MYLYAILVVFNPVFPLPQLPLCLTLCSPSPSYLYAIAMARHIDHQVEGKRIQQFDITKLCGTVKDIHTGFSRMQEMSLPSEYGGSPGREGGREGGREVMPVRGVYAVTDCLSYSVVIRPIISGPSLATGTGVLGMAGTCLFLPCAR